jgi:hypothetical protein
MLRILPSELILFARALSDQPRDARPSVAQLWLKQARQAHEGRDRQRICHIHDGDGSLASLLLKRPIPPLTYGDDPEFLSSLRIVADAVLTHTARTE